MIATLKKLLKLPTPVDLGWSSSNALPMRSFHPDVLGWTWEDYHSQMKSKYPVRYFIFETLRRFVSTYLLHPLKNTKWYFIERWFKKNHMLDLRQVSWVPGCDEYDWGYLDPRTEMLFACMNSLDRFVKEAHARSHLDWLESQLATIPDTSPEKQVLEDNIMLYREALEIHKWWNVDRKTKFVKFSDEDDYSTDVGKRAVFDRWEKFEQEEDEMMIRLMRIRRGLWS
jgi:hypothetical protein